MSGQKRGQLLGRPADRRALKVVKEVRDEVKPKGFMANVRISPCWINLSQGRFR